MIIKDLGAVSAYAYAVEKGYTGTEEEYAELMASYATVAEEAAESAESASQSATQAGASAQTATTKASEASTSATQAGASATSASQSAQTATTKASEASASATQASTKASEASTSATTASSKASEASASATSAQIAQGLAEVARDDAVDAKTDAESARDLAQQYAESIDPEKIYSAYPTDTASGSVASFADGADDIPLKSCVVAIEPVQSGSGDPSPTNIRPILGWTGAQVWRAGKNLFDKTKTVRGYINDGNGELIDNGRPNVASDYIPVAPNQSYYIKSEQLSGAWGAWYDADKNYISGIAGYVDDTSEVNKMKTSPNNAHYMRLTVVIAPSNSEPSGNPDTFSVNYPSTDHDYHPYAGDTYSITLPTEAGTVYGGELDVTNGTLTVDRAMGDLGTLSWNKKVSGVFYAWDLQNLVKAVSSASLTANAKCSSLKLGSYIDVYDNATLDYAISVGSRSQVGAQCSAYAEATDFKSAMNGVQFCYELATPITYHLTPTEIKSILGDNNIWADAGDTSVEYRADTKLYIDKKIAEVINALS